MQKTEETKYRLIADILAWGATVDGTVSPGELSAMHDFIAGYFPPSASGPLFERFCNAIRQQVEISGLENEIRREFLPGPERLGLFAALASMLSVGNYEDGEVAILHDIGDVLELEPPVVDLVLHGHEPLPEFTFPANLDKCLHLSRIPELATSRQPAAVALAFSTGWLVYSHSSPIYMDDRHVPRATFTVLDPGRICRVDDIEFSTDDLQLLLEMQTEEWELDRLFTFGSDQLKRVFDSSSWDFGLTVSGSAILAAPGKKTGKITVNGHNLETELRVFPRDRIGSGSSGGIVLSRFLKDASGETWALEENGPLEFRYTVSSQPGVDADLLVSGETDARITVELHQAPDQKGILNLAVQQDSAMVWLDGAPLGLSHSAILSAKALLQVGPHRLAIDPAGPSVSHSRSSVETFEVRGLQLWIQKPEDTQTIDFVSHAGELIAVMGASGSGKSTLLRTLLGYDEPRSGSILFNGQDFRANFSRCRSILGYVPQDDLLMDNLTVHENLLFAGQIRLPYLSRVQLEHRISQVLSDINLADKRDLVVGNPVNKILSGGQRKRLNIGIELLADPDLFFLDEPTSGLSSKDSESIIGLLKQLTRRGKLVFTVIHQPNSHIYRQFDKLLLVDVGGRLAWFGPALDAINHFRAYLHGHQEFTVCPACGSVNPEIIFESIEQKVRQQKGGAETRRYGSDFWHSVFRLRESPPALADGVPRQGLPPSRPGGLKERIKSFVSALGRNVTDKMRDQANIVVTLAAPLLLGAVMALMLRGPLVPYTYSENPSLERFFFLSAIVFVFFGLMSSVNEIIRDRAMINREKIANFSAFRYVGAKWVAFLPFSLLQSCLYALVAALVLQFPAWGPAGLSLQPILPFPVFFALVCLLIEHAAWALGLLLSSFLRSSIVAFNLIPVIIIPQILLGGVFVAYEDMPKVFNRIVPEYAEITFTRWGYEALVAGEELLNPHESVQPDQVRKFQQDLASRGLSFDYKTMVDTPVKAWQAEAAFTLPPASISTVSLQKLEDRLETHGAVEDKKFLEASYGPAGDSSVRNIDPDLGIPEKKRLAEMFLEMKSTWWGSAYTATEANHQLQSTVFRARSEAGRKDQSGILPLLVDQADFPSKHRFAWAGSIPSTVWDCSVLIVMSVFCLAMAVLRLGRTRH